MYARGGKPTTGMRSNAMSDDLRTRIEDILRNYFGTVHDEAVFTDLATVLVIELGAMGALVPTTIDDREGHR